MKTVIDTLFLRRPPLNYLSPGICEAVFSSTGFPIIILPEFVHARGPTGLIITGAFGHRRLSWNAYPNAFCYNVYEAACSPSVPPETLSYTLIADCVPDPFFDLPGEGCYRVTAVTTMGETELSAPVCTCENPPQPPQPPLETPVLSRSGVILSWTVTGTQPVTAVVERSTDGGSTWNAYGSAPWSGTLHVNSDFDYRVRGFSAGVPSSLYSNVVNVPLHPTSIDWRTRALNNGGTLNGAQSTRAQSDFCYYLDEHALRASVLMFNSLVPDSLISCLTPLFTSIGTGGLFDPWINHNFVGADLTINGLQGNGINKSASTGFVPSSGYAGNDSACCFVYESTFIVVPPGQAKCSIGGSTTGTSGPGSQSSFAIIHGPGATAGYCWDNNVSSNIAIPGTTAPGFILSSRTSPTEFRLYFANSLTPWAELSSTAIPSNESRPASEIYICSIPVVGVGEFFYTDRRISAAGVGLGLTSAQGALLFEGVQALRVALGGGFA